MRIGSWILFVIVLLLEGTVTSVPLVLIFLLCLMVMKRAEWIFILALGSGIALDVFTLRPIGTTSVALVTFVFLVSLYERKYEIATVPFVMGASFIGTLLFSIFLGSFSLLESFTSAVIAAFAFIIYTRFTRPGVPTHLDYVKA